MAIRIKRVKEPLLLMLEPTPTKVETEKSNKDSNLLNNTGKNAKSKMEVPSNMVLDEELYEGIVSQPIIEPTVSEVLRYTVVL